MKLLAGQNIHPVGGTEGDSITDTCEFLKDLDTHMIKLLTVKVAGDNPEQITFHVILGSNVPPILGTQYTSPQHKTYTTSAVTNRTEQNRQYKPGDSVNFLKNTVNSQRTHVVIVEQVMGKQYRVRYGDNQQTKVTTNNMVSFNTPDTEANPEENNITIEDIEEDTGLTQQPMIWFTLPYHHKEFLGTDLSPWSDEDEVIDPEYPEQPDDPGKNPGSSSQTGGNTANEPDVTQSQHDDPEVTNVTGYPDTQEINTGTPQNPDLNKSSDTEQGSIPTSHQEIFTSITVIQGLIKPPREVNTQGGLTMTIWIPHAPVLEDPQGLD